MKEYAYVVNVDGVVARQRDGIEEFLIIERADEEDHAAGMLGLPGGKLEAPPGADDAIETTVAREIEEETGVSVDSVEYVCSGTFGADTGEQCLNLVTRCSYEGGEARPREPEEIAAVHWLTLDELRAREDVPAFTEAYVERAAALDAE